MKPVIAVASGKGGTGKTTFAVNLAFALGHEVLYVDADVEEPNGHLYLKPDLEQDIDVKVPLPVVNQDKCNYCGKCSQVCQFKALIVLKNEVIVFPELCHGCGACLLACPQEAIGEEERTIGKISMGPAGNVEFLQGVLNEGEAKSPPLIKRLKGLIKPGKTVIIDASPGTSCPVIEAIRGVDYVVLVTEPTPFGMHDLQLAVEMVRTVGIPFGVVVNRADLGNEDVFDYCQREQIPILMTIPFDRRIAEICSNGGVVAAEIPALKDEFKECFFTINHYLE